MTDTSGSAVHMLVRNPGHLDTRVRKTAAALQRDGHDVTVFALASDDRPDIEELDGIRFERVRFEPTSRDHRRKALQLRQRQRDLRYAQAIARARQQKDAARAFYTARTIEARGRLKTLRRMGVRGPRVYWAMLVRWLQVRLARLLLTTRVDRIRLRRWAAYAIHRLTTRAAKRRWRRREEWHRWHAEIWFYEGFARAVIEQVGDRRAAVVHAHDLNTLWAGWRLARRTGARLVYDSHELELHRNTRWTPQKRAVASRVERFCIKRSDTVITVSDPIADDLRSMYKLRVRPAVVLNSPPLESRMLTVEPGERLRARIGLAADERLMVYVGKVAPGRGVDMLVEALPLLPEDIHLGLLGPREARYDDPLFARAAELGVEQRLHTVPSVPSALVPAVLQGTDLTVNASQNVCRSYDLALPNKLFDTVMAGVPTVVGSLAAMSGFVREHVIGLVCDELDPTDIAEKIQKALATSHEGLQDDALDRLQREVAWEEQVEHLLEQYREMTGAGNGRQSG